MTKATERFFQRFKVFGAEAAFEDASKGDKYADKTQNDKGGDTNHIIIIPLFCDFFESLDELVDIFGASVVAQGAADKRRVFFDVVEVIMSTEIAGARHDALVAESLADKV